MIAELEGRDPESSSNAWSSNEDEDGAETWSTSDDLDCGGVVWPRGSPSRQPSPPRSGGCWEDELGNRHLDSFPSATTMASVEDAIDSADEAAESPGRPPLKPLKPASRVGLVLPSVLWALKPVVWTTWLWHAFFRAVAQQEGLPGSRDTIACMYHCAALQPLFLASLWTLAVIGRAPPWVVFPLLLLSALAFTGDCVYGTSTGMAAVIGVAPTALMIAQWHPTDRWSRTKFVCMLSLVTVLCSTFLALYVRFASCLVAADWAWTYRLLLPIYESISRRCIAFVWDRWAGTAPTALFVMFIASNVMVAEVVQMANFLSVASSSDPWKSGIVLVLTTVLTEWLSRAKLLQVFWNAAAYRHQFRIAVAADLALRARLLYVYTLLPTVLFLLAGWALQRVLPWMVLLMVGVYFVTELTSDCLVLLWQLVLRRMQGDRRSVAALLQKLLEPYGHIFPQFSCLPEPPCRETGAAIGGEEILSDLCGLRPEGMFAVYMASVCSVFAYLTFAGIFVPWAVPCQEFLEMFKRFLE